MTDIEIGSNCNGFVLQRSETIPEIDSTVYLFTHARLGTPALAIKNSDPNKTFCLAFQTVPEDSTGVAHILEHSVLMGSHKYPVKDVFGEINKGGLMTFLNAMTGSDTTWYPFATRNLKEYFNIMDVYCDVTLHPLLLPTTFEQEGWHYHKESEDQPLQYRGVVFNEMKGAFSDPIRAIFHNIFRGLMPGSTYAHESGGDPRNIPDLSYEQFVDFHRRHYHPANATLFFYGDAKLEDELAFVQNNFLRHFAKTGEKARIIQGRDITEPVVIEDTYGIQPGSAIDGKTFLAVGATVGTVLDRRRNAAFQVIANILYNSDASPLKKAIIDAGLGKDFGGLFLTDSCFKTIIMTYLIGSDPDSLESFRKIYQQTLAAMVASGLDHDLVLSELNKYEFSVREEMIKAQRGLDLISKALPALKYEIDPFEALRIEDLFKDIRAKALDGNYFEQLIEKYLLDNPATAEIILRPDPQKMIRTLQEEQQRLAAFEQQLDDQGRKELIRRTRELMELQQRPNDEKTLSLLPRLKLADLQRRIDFHKVRVEEIQGRQFLINDLPTNSISYIDFGLDCSGLTADLLPYLNLFGTIVTEIGTGTRDYMRFATELGICTGGFTHSFNTYTHMEARGKCRPVLWLHLKALSSYQERALSLVGEVFSDVSFSNRRHIKEIVLREFAWAEHSVQSEGYGLASCRVFSHLSPAAKYNEYVNGATAYQ
ncbi:MAG TPA: peptidase M16, partial [Desulfobacteraceae bacterium]|nr:peptidase M16 [Desulfobacteraceae bacterium]